jgi:hypothetical protein
MEMSLPFGAQNFCHSAQKRNCQARYFLTVWPSGRDAYQQLGVHALMSVPHSTPDLRATRRFNLRLPVEVKYSGDSVHQAKAHTRDVSSRGICFYFDTPLATGSDIEFTLTLPPEITLTESIRVRCKGTVVRVEPSPTPGGKVGIAATIQHYEFLSEK